MHSVKLGYLVCAVTVHLLLFLFECHGNKEYVSACLSVCVRTCTCDLSSKREHQFKDFGRSRSPGIETHAHSHTILTSNLFLRFRVAGSNPAGGEILPEPKRRFIAQSLSWSPFHRLEMTEILLKGRKTLTHPSILRFRTCI